MSSKIQEVIKSYRLPNLKFTNIVDECLLEEQKYRSWEDPFDTCFEDYKFVTRYSHPSHIRIIYNRDLD